MVPGAARLPFAPNGTVRTSSLGFKRTQLYAGRGDRGNAAETEPVAESPTGTEVSAQAPSAPAATATTDFPAKQA